MTPKPDPLALNSNPSNCRVLYGHGGCLLGHSWGWVSLWALSLTPPLPATLIHAPSPDPLALNSNP